jgi:hypothetical protein
VCAVNASAGDLTEQLREGFYNGHSVFKLGNEMARSDRDL